MTATTEATVTDIATRTSAQLVGGVSIDYEAVLRTLKLDPTDPKVQALVLVCQQYGLDPVLKHAVLVEGNVYVTRDGLLHVAHKSGVFDGIEVVEGPTKAADGDWVAKVAVYRKDMQRPITYPGRYPASGSNKKYAPEMAIKVAEVQALRRAFDVAISTVEEQYDRFDVGVQQATQEQLGNFTYPPAVQTAIDVYNGATTVREYRAVFDVLRDGNVPPAYEVAVDVPDERGIRPIVTLDTPGAERMAIRDLVVESGQIAAAAEASEPVEVVKDGGAPAVLEGEVIDKQGQPVLAPGELPTDRADALTPGEVAAQLGATVVGDVDPDPATAAAPVVPRPDDDAQPRWDGKAEDKAWRSPEILAELLEKMPEANTEGMCRGLLAQANAYRRAGEMTEEHHAALKGAFDERLAEITRAAS